MQSKIVYADLQYISNILGKDISSYFHLNWRG